MLDGSVRKGRLRRLLPFLGPAFIASIAYMDPGNFATNISGGAQFGFMLLWVILASNLKGRPARVRLEAFFVFFCWRSSVGRAADL